MAYALIASFFLIFVTILKSAYIIPQKQVFIIERFGKYQKQLHAGLNIIIPFIDKVSYRHSLKEIAIDTPMQVCITKDNISVEVDGVLYLRIMDPKKASYGIHDYLFATTQIAQTTMRSVIGKLLLDESFEEREHINSQIVEATDSASDPWGIKVTRYEIKDIKPPQSIKDAMEKQMRAEREKRALIAKSEGEKQSKINESEGEKQSRINEAEGRGFSIQHIAHATAEGMKEIASTLCLEGGIKAAELEIAKQYLKEFGKLAKEGNTFIIPAELSDVSSMVAAATSLVSGIKKNPKKTIETLRDSS
ncbi:MAG: SPFH domain-containing protein [Simkaniaceae bacterium]